MLILGRRVGEEIVIAGDIRVTVVAVQRDRVRLGISAPNDVVVDRAEVHERRCAALAGEVELEAAAVLT
jgi:carbon storage regulator